MPVFRIVQLAIAACSVWLVIVRPAAGGQQPTLSELSAEWRRVAAQPGSRGCAAKERIWLELRRRFRGWGTWLPPMTSVGDCWVGVNDEAHARDFYHAVIRSFRSAECDKEGVSCGLIAAEELRRLNCGFEWLAPDPQTVWTDVAAAVKSPATAARVSAHLEPDVRAGVTGDDAWSEKCLPRAFDVPKTFSKEADRIVELSQDLKTPLLARVIVLKIADEDKPWKNRSADIYKFFHLRVCRYARPVPSRVGSRYYLQLALTAQADEEPSCPDR